ncbi:MAG: hypothetical protein C0436_02615 [Alphaproteobacteria bacterium]|nr:hypothetical protein [Alphaproteobacteria bacterium]
MPQMVLHKSGDRTLKRLVKRHPNIRACYEATEKKFNEGLFREIGFKPHQGTKDIYKVELVGKWPWRVMLRKLEDDLYVAYEITDHDGIYKH